MSSDAFPVESNGLSESGNGLSTKGAYKDHGWQKVTNLKKQRRQAAKSSTGADKSDGFENVKSDSKAFQALETEAEERRARRKAKLEAAAAAAAAYGAEFSHSGEDDSDADENGAKANGGKDNADAKKSKPKKPKKPKVTVAEAAAAINVDELATFLTEISESFATLPDVQLIRLADYFARAFNPVTNAQFAWNKILRESPFAKTVEIPLCYIPEPVAKVTSDWLAQKPADALSKFAFWLLKEILDEPQQQHHKGSKTVAALPTKAKVGVLVILALLVRRKPEAFLQQASAVRAQFVGQEKLHTLAWVYGQALQGDLVVGMALWVQNLLPLAVGKSSTPASRDIALQFIENLLFANTKKARTILLNGATRKGERLVPPAAYELVLRAAYPIESAKTKATERFLAIYPLIKEIVLAGTSRSKATKPVAQQLLPLSLAGAADDVPAIQAEACGNFVWCLSQNADSYKQWEKLHLENLKGSTRILNHINNEWKDTSAHLIPLDDLKKTLLALSLKHRNGMESAEGDALLESQLKAAESVCKSLLRKTSRVPSCTKAVATLAVCAGIGYGFYLISPTVNPWDWDGKLLLSKTHSMF
ncbi:hypothetical protein MPTK1_2g04670 [Marchantia polymorpha subsp. ruderalis]|uniref:Uncharacterized protein n=2 Tax=Marchantia polymorpha TaxID=3197 RepID=A0A176VZX2_MARPO|nr:hypothetical protein AXG93_4324s1310 [Marchantia polymorpha subsp. ruderalis]PTQ42154.1 hypothetical protein MARPO_0031s0122 [Marchantia polymorpha]BBN01105.1 hypothetical protein Mp_2g04670 [Marchantia polymorpha subsp. ruderalis]|eukprot:PTQ42154.1 hypothetical protein MARPO_0031s0122 [Marchantia polymorpha]